MEISDYRVPKTKVGQKTFDRIIKAGKKLFAESGYMATSINDIIAKAKVAAGTFYIYFDNKLALYLYLVDFYRVTIRKASVAATANLKTRREMERAGLKAWIEYVREDPLAYKIIWESLFVDYNIFKEYYQSFSQSYVYHLKHFVTTGEIRPDIDLETVSYVLMGMSNFIGLQILFKDKVEDDDIDRVVDEAMKLLDDGIFLKPAQ